MGEWEGLPHFIPLARSELIDLVCAATSPAEDCALALRALCDAITVACWDTCFAWSAICLWLKT